MFDEPATSEVFSGLSVPDDAAINPLRGHPPGVQGRSVAPYLLESLANRDLRWLAVSVVANFDASGFANIKLKKFMSKKKPRVRALLNILRNLPSGPISGDQCDEVRRLLQECWLELEGGQATSMAPWKVSRAEDLRWDPPYLSFIIERHGATVLGSSRAELQVWTIDVEKGTASYAQKSYRQIRPTSPRLDVKPIVEAICEVVQQGPQSNSALIQNKIVRFRETGEVSIRHGDLISGDNKQTKAGRRKRLRDALIVAMKAMGWDFVAVRTTMIFKRSPD